MKLVRVLIVAFAITCIASSSFAMQHGMMMGQPMITEGMVIMKMSPNGTLKPIRMKGGQMMTLTMNRCLKMNGVCMPMLAMQGCMTKMPMLIENNMVMPMMPCGSDQYVADGMMMEGLMMPVIMDNCMVAMIPVVMRNGLLVPMMMKKGVLKPMKKPIMLKGSGCR